MASGWRSWSVSKYGLYVFQPNIIWYIAKTLILSTGSKIARLQDICNGVVNMCALADGVHSEQRLPTPWHQQSRSVGLSVGRSSCFFVWVVTAIFRKGSPIFFRRPKIRNPHSLVIIQYYPPPPCMRFRWRLRRRTARERPGGMLRLSGQSISRESLFSVLQYQGLRSASSGFFSVNYGGKNIVY